MSKFPDWARPWLASQSSQVSHGLNLVLELRNPASTQLPQMLWDIVLAQDKIKRALESLSFVHYARFIPSWDGCALMVTTEFDGPLDPYVLDFVTALGDVFDTLLSYVKEQPPMPVRDHPDEFLAWVRRWNRVPFHMRGPLTLFPEDFDYPLYSAYPDKTVTDIAGPRLQPPPPALDHPAAAVDPADVQGNILRGYGARHGRYLFFSITDASLARRWLAKDLPNVAKPWLGVGSAVPWVGTPPAVLTQVAFTHEGLAKLLVPARQGELSHFPAAFKEGAASRAEANFDRDTSAPAHWLFGRIDEPVHLVLFLYTKQDPAPAAFLAAVTALETGQAQGLKFLRTLTGEWRGGTEPFGFADGISDPRISGQCPAAGAEPAFQPAASPGEFLLHETYASIYGGSSLGAMPQGLAGNGSFGVLRLMEQDVDLFNQATDDEAVRLGVEPKRLRAKMVGRWKNGAPLALAPDNENQAGAVNAFDYAPSWEFPNQINDHDGMRCPVGAHVRRANPRSARVAGQPHSRRLLRRGLSSSWTDGTGKPRVGLMGLFMGASIEQQFEFIQRQWLQGDLAASGIRGTTDAISAIRTGKTDFPFLETDPVLPKGPPRRLVAHIPSLVQTRGCLYLFFPGIAALKALDATVSPVTTVIASAVAAQQAIEQATSTAVTAGSQVVGDSAKVIGSIFQGIGDAAAHVGSGVTAAVSKVADSLPIDTSQLPGVDVSALLTAELKDLLEVQELWKLADGDWRDFIRDLVDRNLESPWVKRVIDAFAPPPVAVQPPANIDVADFNLADPRFRADPYEALRQLRDAGKRIVWVPAQQACWVLDNAGCQDLFSRNEHFVQTPAGTRLRGIVTLDVPRHTEVSKAYAAAFGAALAAVDMKIEPTVVRAVAGLKGQTNLRQFDYMQAFAHPVARAVVWQLIGIIDTDGQKACDALADTLVLHYGKTAQPGGAQSMVAADAGLRLAARLSVALSVAWLDSFKSSPKYEGTLIGELAARMGTGLPIPSSRPLGFIETLLTLVQTVLASQSPHFLLGSAALHLMSPDPRPGKGGKAPWPELAALSTNKAAFDKALGLALDEARRCEPPLTLVERYANGAQNICGVRVPDGCAVFAMVASANRDKGRYGQDAEEFHVERAAAAGHLSLGHGIHECAGRALQAKLLPAALGGIIAALPELRLSNPAAKPAWHATIYFRVLQALSVTRCPP